MMRKWHGRIQEVMNILAVAGVLISSAVASWLHSMPSASHTRQAVQPLFDSLWFLLPALLVMWLAYSIFNVVYSRRSRSSKGEK